MEEIRRSEEVKRSEKLRRTEEVRRFEEARRFVEVMQVEAMRRGEAERRAESEASLRRSASIEEEVNLCGVNSDSLYSSDPGHKRIQLNEEKVKQLENDVKKQKDKINGLMSEIKDLKAGHDKEAEKSKSENMKLNNTLERVLEDNAELREVAKTSLVVAAEVVKMKEEMADMARQMRNMMIKQTG